MMIGILGQRLASADYELLYEAQNATIVSTLMACNTDTGTGRTIYISVVPSGKKLNGVNQAIYAGYSLAASATMTCTAGITLAPGDSIWVKSGTADKIVYTAFGEEDDGEEFA